VGRILIVDTDANLAAAVRRALGDAAAAVRRVETLEEASTAPSRPTELVFLRTGPDQPRAAAFLEPLRLAMPSVPVVIVASQPSPGEEIALRRQGILCYLAEPVSDGLLRQVLSSATRCACGLRSLEGFAPSRGPAAENGGQPLASQPTRTRVPLKKETTK
jgi:DNA-binding response OmpR family regulator